MVTWNDTAQHFTRVTDKLGKRIDIGIFDTVVALNMLGVNTTQSCEGHLDWGLPYPWVNIEAEMEQKFLLHKYLLQFYAERPVNFDCVLVFNGYRVRSQGAAFSELFTDEERQQKLKVYQEEMHAFTVFLKSLLDRWIRRQ